jgi:hypothetical protein
MSLTKIRNMFDGKIIVGVVVGTLALRLIDKYAGGFLARVGL